MRPLNRPMFKNGGPIKEGIMSGMKDSPQQLVQPAADGSRPGYAGPFALAPLVFAAGRALARPFGTFVARNVFGKPTVTTGAGGAKTIASNIVGTKNVFKPNPFGKYLLESPEGRFLTGASGKAGAAGKKVLGVGKSLAKSPLTVGSVLYYGGGALLPDGTPDPEDPKNYKPADERGKSGAPGGGDPDMFLEPRKKDSKINREDEIEANRKRYYKLMGIDKMQKGAAYDSLIDASKIIQEEGGDLKGSIKSGNLQTRIIDAISKNLDKSADLKKQIDAAILKGEIQKDIKASDPAAKLAAELTKKRIQLADKTLEGGDLSEALLAAYNKQQVFPAGNQLAAVARAKGVNIDGVEDTQEVKKWIKENKSDEEGYISSLVKEGKVPDGTYVINNRIFTVSGDDIISVV